MQQICILAKFIKKIKCNNRLLSVSCSIMDAYQSCIYDSDWETVESIRDLIKIYVDPNFEL